MKDYYDSRGRLLDGPDDPGQAACSHGNAVDECQECVAEFERERQEHQAWGRANPGASIQTPYPPNLEDLPY